MFAGHNGYVTSMIYEKKRDYLISSGEDQTLRWWNMESTENVKIIKCPTAYVLKIYQEEFLITGHENGEIRFWDLGLKRLICLKTAKVFIRGLAVVDSNKDQTQRTDIAGGIQKIIYGEFNDLAIMQTP